MRTEYISLTNAINLFEDHKIKQFTEKDFLQGVDFTQSGYKSTGVNTTSSDNGVGRNLSEREVLESQSLIYFLKEYIYPTDPELSIHNKYNLYLYGKSLKNNELSNEFEVISDDVIKSIYNKMDGENATSILLYRGIMWPYIIYNNYDHVDIYNDSYNYDTLRDGLTGKDMYFSLSIKYTELVTFINTLFSV